MGKRLYAWVVSALSVTTWTEVLHGERQADIADEYPTAPIVQPVVAFSPLILALSGVAFFSTLAVGNLTDSGTR